MMMGEPRMSIVTGKVYNGSPVISAKSWSVKSPQMSLKAETVTSTEPYAGNWPFGGSHTMATPRLLLR